MGMIVEALDFYGRYVAIMIAAGAVFIVVIWLGSTLISWKAQLRPLKNTKAREP